MSNKATKLTLKRNKKLDKIYHPESGLVFKSASEKIVIGRIADDEFISLDEDTIALCEQYGQEYDKSLVEEVEDEAGSQENEVQEVENQEVDTNQEVENQEVDTKQENEVQEVVSQEVVSQENENQPDVKVKNVSEISTLISSFSSTISGIIASKDKVILEKDGALQSSVNAHKKDRETFSAKEKELSETISKLQKELEEVKKKLKGVLLAMQGEL